jgi:hypothetical protein
MPNCEHSRSIGDILPGENLLEILSEPEELFGCATPEIRDCEVITARGCVEDACDIRALPTRSL